MTFIKDNIHGNFSPVADQYEKGRHEYPPEVMQWVHRHIPAGLVLDLGCGTGISTRQLSSQGLEVIGTDVSEEMIAVAREKNGEITYLVTRAEKLPFEDKHFDGVTAFTSFHWFDNVEALGEITRVLKVGHPFCVIHGLPGPGPRGAALYRPMIENLVGRKLPNAYDDFDPERTMRDFGMANVSSEIFLYPESRTIEDFLVYIQSVSLWNYVPVELRVSTLELLRKHFQEQFPDGQVTRTMKYIMVAGYR